MPSPTPASSSSAIVISIDWSAITTWAFLVVDIGLRIFAIFWIPRNRRPQTSAAWLLAIRGERWGLGEPPSAAALAHLTAALARARRWLDARVGARRCQKQMGRPRGVGPSA